MELSYADTSQDDIGWYIFNIWRYSSSLELMSNRSSQIRCMQEYEDKQGKILYIKTP